MTSLTLALDLMGGDFGPRVTFPALVQALVRYPMLSFLVFGHQTESLPYINSLSPAYRQRVHFTHADKNIDTVANFSQAMRQSKESSMYLALKSVAEGKAQGCVSGGNTGILMGLARQLISPLHNIERPALATLIPNLNQKATVMLDLGANIEVNAELLLQFAQMGNAFAHILLDLVEPRIALLNIGTEEHKGHATIRIAHQQLKHSDQLNYIGFLESDKIMNNMADVIVCDGVSGNIALKAMEGIVKNMMFLLENSSKTSHFHHVKRFVKRLVLHRYYQHLQLLNPERHNGATLLGLSAVVVKSHGIANKNSFFCAIEHAIQQIKLEIPARILQKLNQK